MILFEFTSNNQTTIQQICYDFANFVVSIYYLFSVIPNETKTIESFGPNRSKDGLSPIVVALIVMLAVLVVIFTITLAIIKKRLKMRSQEMGSARYRVTTRQNEDYDFVNESTVREDKYLSFKVCIQ